MFGTPLRCKSGDIYDSAQKKSKFLLSKHSKTFTIMK